MNVVAIGIDKVQTFLYDAIHSPTQKNQTNSGTLSAVMGASRMISNEFYEVIGLEKKSETAAESGAVKEPAFFANHVREPLLKCSGTYVFTTDLEGTELKNALKGVFEKYYTDYNGRLLVKYVHFEKDPKTDREKLDAILKGKKLLKSNACMSLVLEDNADLLFQFRAVSDATIKNRKSGKSEAELVNADDGTPIKCFFVNNIDRLSPEGKEGNQDHFRIAVIKADLDGMGDFFSGIRDDFDFYKKVSGILNEEISLFAMNERIAEMEKEGSNFLVYPLYVAGDDIMFAVNATDLKMGVALCERMVNKINERICTPKDKMASRLAVSIGIDFTFNNEPIRYYHQRVQKQLDDAKKAKGVFESDSEKIAFHPQVKICMNDFVFQMQETENIPSKEGKGKNKKKTQKKSGEGKAEELTNWFHFLHDVTLLRHANGVGFAGHHFLYGLLNKLTDPALRGEENVIKRSNAILYHLLPKYEGHPDLSKLELQLLKALWDKISVKTIVEEDSKDKSSPKKGKLQYELSFNDADCAKLETYVRLLLLFLDPRYSISQILKESSEENHDESSNEKRREAFDKKKIRTVNFNRTMRYLYNNNFGEGALRDCFIKIGEYTPEDQAIQVYQTLHLSHSIFYRMKRMGANAIENANMINLVANGGQEESQKEHSEPLQDDCTPPPSLRFDPETFKQAVGDSALLWDEDYLNSLLIFYRYKELLIRYRMLYPSPKGKKAKRRKEGSNRSWKK